MNYNLIPTLLFLKQLDDLSYKSKQILKEKLKLTYNHSKFNKKWAQDGRK